MAVKANVTVKKTGFFDGKPKKPNFRPLASGVEAIVVGHIVERTSDGIDIHGRAFKPYSQEHSLVRRLSGRSANPVQLIWSGKMLNSVAALARQVVGTSMTITFGVKPRDERNLIAAYQQRTRRWFGLSPDGNRELSQWVARNLLSIWGAPLVNPPREPRKKAEQPDKKARGQNKREAEQELQGLAVQTNGSYRRAKAWQAFHAKQTAARRRVQG
jgi:hypothetical protein